MVNTFAILTCILRKKETDSRYINQVTDYGRPVRKSPSLDGRNSSLNPDFSGIAGAYVVCQIGPKFQISLSYAFIGCP